MRAILLVIAALVSSIALADSLGPVPSTGQGCVNGICDAGLYVVGGGPSVGTDTSGDLVLSGAPLPSYIIPETGTVFYTHVNATDLHNGTDKRGGVWTQNGTVPFNAGPLPSVGPFTDSNYFSQTTSPAGVSGGPFTIAMLVNVSNVASGPVLLSSGSYYAQIGNSGWSFDNNGFFATSTPLPGSTTALLFLGADSSGNIYSQVNNGPVTSTTYTTPGSPGTTVYIGRYFSGTGYGFTGTISEVMISNAVASHAAFNSIYSTVQTEIAPVVTTQYPTFFPSETVGNFLYVDGGFQVGGASGISPVFIGSGPFDSAYAGIWIGQSAISATQTNFTFLSNGANYTLLNSPSGQLGLAIGNGEILICDPSLCAFTNSYSSSGAGQLSMWVGVTTPATIAAAGVAAALSVDSSLDVNLNLGTGNAFQIANDGGVVTASINASGAVTGTSVDAGSALVNGRLTLGTNGNAFQLTLNTNTIDTPTSTGSPWYLDTGYSAGTLDFGSGVAGFRWESDGGQLATLNGYGQWDLYSDGGVDFVQLQPGGDIIVNDGTHAMIIGAGGSSGTNFNAVESNTSDAGLNLLGNCNANAATCPDVISNSRASRAAGFIHEFDNGVNGQQATIAYNGKVWTDGGAADIDIGGHYQSHGGTPTIVYLTSAVPGSAQITAQNYLVGNDTAGCIKISFDGGTVAEFSDLLHIQFAQAYPNANFNVQCSVNPYGNNGCTYDGGVTSEEVGQTSPNLKCSAVSSSAFGIECMNNNFVSPLPTSTGACWDGGVGTVVLDYQVSGFGG